MHGSELWALGWICLRPGACCPEQRFPCRGNLCFQQDMQLTFSWKQHASFAWIQTYTFNSVELRKMFILTDCLRQRVGATCYGRPHKVCEMHSPSWSRKCLAVPHTVLNSICSHKSQKGVYVWGWGNGNLPTFPSYLGSVWHYFYSTKSNSWLYIIKINATLQYCVY